VARSSVTQLDEPVAGPRPFPARSLTAERVMACIDPDASALSIIHAAARLASELSAVWYAVSVESTLTRHERTTRHRQHSSVHQANIDAAEGLGGIVVHVVAERPADGLIAFAEREGVTHVVYGKSVTALRGRNGDSDSVRIALENGLHGATLVAVDSERR
jgi:K+-sensing histidine kinase KdpD